MIKQRDDEGGTGGRPEQAIDDDYDQNDFEQPSPKVSQPLPIILLAVPILEQALEEKTNAANFGIKLAREHLELGPLHQQAGWGFDGQASCFWTGCQLCRSSGWALQLFHSIRNVVWRGKQP